MRDDFPSPLLHMASSMIIIVVPYVGVVLIFIGSMIGRETHWLDLSLGKEIHHTFCTTSSKGSMGGDMATTKKHLFLYEVGHEIDWSTWAMTLINNWEKRFYELPCNVVQQQLGKLHCDHLGNCWYLSSLHETFNIPLTWMPYDDDFLFIICGMIWASMIDNVGGKIFGDPIFFLPLGGNIFAAQE